MHVEVNETNIAVFELDKLTGNSREELLHRAKEAEAEGYILSCQIPEQDVTVNAFQHFGAAPAPKVDERPQLRVVEDQYGTRRTGIEGDSDIVEGGTLGGVVVRGVVVDVSDEED